MFIIFWDVLMVDQTSLSPQVKRSVTISNKMVYMSSLVISSYIILCTQYCVWYYNVQFSASLSLPERYIISSFLSNFYHFSWLRFTELILYLDHIMIYSVRFFVLKGWLVYQIYFFVYYERVCLVMTEIFQGTFQTRN